MVILIQVSFINWFAFLIFFSQFFFCSFFFFFAMDERESKLQSLNSDKLLTYNRYLVLPFCDKNEKPTESGIILLWNQLWSVIEICIWHLCPPSTSQKEQLEWRTYSKLFPTNLKWMSGTTTGRTWAWSVVASNQSPSLFFSMP